MKDKILEVRNVSFSYEKSQVLQNISFDIFEGDYLGVIGPNGSGKTTLLKLCLGLIPLQTGEIRLFGEDIQKTSNRKKLSYISQKSNSFNISFPATVAEVISSSIMSLGYDKKSAAKMTDSAIGKIGIEKLKDKMIGDLSGGEQQKAFIAKAIATEPRIIFLDEPTVGIDYGSEQFFYNIMHHLNAQGVTVFMVSHDISAVTSYTNKVACIGENTFHIHLNDETLDMQKSLTNIYGKNMSFIAH